MFSKICYSYSQSATIIADYLFGLTALHIRVKAKLKKLFDSGQRAARIFHTQAAGKTFLREFLELGKIVISYSVLIFLRRCSTLFRRKQPLRGCHTNRSSQSLGKVFVKYS